MGMELILPRNASDSLLNEFMRGAEGITEISHALGGVRSKDAVASRRKDELRVKLIIEESVGFDAVDDKVVSCLVKCAVQQVQVHLEERLQVQDRKVIQASQRPTTARLQTASLFGQWTQ